MDITYFTVSRGLAPNVEFPRESVFLHVSDRFFPVVREEGAGPDGLICELVVVSCLLDIVLAVVVP
jgi:hypothetical protein